MKLSTAFPMAAATLMASHTRAYYEPNGAVFSNINTVQDMAPHVVWNHLSKCANLPSYVPPQGKDCLIETYINTKFPGATWGDRCSPPNDSRDAIESDLQKATIQCPDFTNAAFITVEAYLIDEVFSAGSCWSDLCERDDIILQVESDHIETCTGAQLPYPVASSMFLSDDKKEDALVTCMLEYVMETPAMELDLDKPPSSCYPPGYQMMDQVCQTGLGPLVFERCTDSTEFMFLEDDMSMSFDYSMSMMMDDEPQQNPFMADFFTILDSFCEILERVTMESGLKCLDQICDSAMNPTAMPNEAPSAAPTSPPSNKPSLRPSTAPSAAPSMSPSEAPSTVPTMDPSAAPSAAPTMTPSAAPSIAPSIAPSSSPTAAPSVEDSVVVTNPEVVDSAAVHVSTASILTLVGVVLSLLTM